MNDDLHDTFLTQLREAPEAQFANALRQKLSKISLTPERRSNMLFQTLTRKTGLAWAAVMLAVSTLLLMSIAPVRAFVADLLVEVAGQSFEVTDDYPGSASDDKTVIYPQSLPLSEALATFPHTVHLPNYTPPGYVLDAEHVNLYVGAEAGFLADTLEVRWWRAQRSIGLRISSVEMVEIVAPDSTEEIMLASGHSAALIRGGWDYDQKAWGDAYGELRLRWAVDGLFYDLSGENLEELLAVAQSIPADR